MSATPSFQKVDAVTIPVPDLDAATCLDAERLVRAVVEAVNE